MGINDEPVEVRKGEELDSGKVGEFIRENIGGIKGDVQVQQFPSGFSNLTYMVKAGDRELVLRRPPFGKKAKTAHDMSREFRMLRALKPVFPYCPEALVLCEDPEVMGSPFYIMERIHGIILRRDLPNGLNLSPEQARRLSENLIRVQCELHSLDYRAIGLEDFGRPEGYIKRQVEGWSGRYRDARTEDAPDFEKVMGWLHAHMPEESSRPGVIHNDYKFDNVVLNPDNPLEITGVLDWEMATIGDPLMDLGSSLAYWVQKDDPEETNLMRTMPTNLDGMLTRDEQISLYRDITGYEFDNFDFYYCFGLFRLAVIAQQIYYRYFHGQTKDERFKMLIFGVTILEKAAIRLIKESGIS